MAILMTSPSAMGPQPSAQLTVGVRTRSDHPCQVRLQFMTYQHRYISLKASPDCLIPCWIKKRLGRGVHFITSSTKYIHPHVVPLCSCLAHPHGIRYSNHVKMKFVYCAAKSNTCVTTKLCGSTSIADRKRSTNAQLT